MAYRANANYLQSDLIRPLIVLLLMQMNMAFHHQLPYLVSTDLYCVPARTQTCALRITDHNAAYASDNIPTC